MRSVMKHSFSEVPRATISRSSFDRSHGHKTTLDAGYLVPIYVDEVLPGDSFNLRMTGFARMATPIKPIMDNMFMETFFFFVPNRLLWDGWEEFMGNSLNAAGAQLPDDPIEDVVNDVDVPTINIPSGLPELGPQTIWDYMGIPQYSDAQVTAVVLPFRAYNLIWNEWFRHEFLQAPVKVETGNTDFTANYQLLRRGKRHDYFTSCLPWPQRGPEVTIPTLGSAQAKAIPGAETRLGELNAPQNNYSLQGTSGQNNIQINGTWTQSGKVTFVDPLPFNVDLTEASTVSINELRTAFQLQKMYERDARGGTRYTEIIHAHFGVTSPDARLQRPEYLGGGSSRININQVEQTTQDIEGAGANTPQGNLAAYATANMHGHGFTKSFTEHGYIIGLINVRADLTYQEGLNRMYQRRGRYDFFWPALQHVGEQPVLKDEIYASSDNDLAPVFGYQEQYAEYRYYPSKITGKFRSNDPQSLDIWHLSQDFDSSPALNATFIEDNPPIERVIAIPSEPHFLLDCYFKLRCARPMPLYGIPGNIDRF